MANLELVCRIKVAMSSILNYEIESTANKGDKLLLRLNKHKSLLKATNEYLLLITFLICLMPAQVLPTSTIESMYSKQNNLYVNDLSSRMSDYSAKILNITTALETVSKSEPKFLLPTVFPSSFIFYGDENDSNLLNRNDVLERHFINKMPPNKNFTKANIRTSKKTFNKINCLASEEEYDDYGSVPLNKNNLKSSDISSCSVCKQHERAKKENLESIKKHILMRLQLSQPPNITVPPPAVPQKILDYFYKNFNYSRSFGHSPFNQSRKVYKRKTKHSPMVVEDQVRNEGKNDKYLSENRDDNGENYKLEDDIMVSDNTFFDGNFATSMQQVDEFYSRLHSIYVFPTKSRIHYNRKPEIFNFKYNSDPSRISSTILHVFIKGHDWMYKYQPDLIENKNADVSVKRRQEIMIVIYRALRRPNSMNYTHTVKLIESRQKIPSGFGQWVEIEIKELSTYWMKTPNSTQSIVIRGMESWMRTFIVTEDQSNDKLTMHIEIVTKVNHRYKRNTALDCRESDNEVRCCRYPLKVNFTNFGWNFIVAPQHFDAYFCNGECNVGYLEKYTHTHITSLSTSAKPCCSPQKLSPLALLYFDNNNKLMYSTIPNMSVEKCSCS